jgi:hypothetical protein
MKIDFATGRVIYNDEVDDLKASLEDLKIEDEIPKESIFSKTMHKNLKYGRLKYMLYCFLLMMDGIIGLVSLGQTQSIMASKYLLSDYVMGDYDANR